ncbi:MAG: Cytochrome c, partial [Gemmatimonadetes bacterium]|nr:Cytochrome c [Gemmatimonadota bacterium]
MIASDRLRCLLLAAIVTCALASSAHAQASSTTRPPEANRFTRKILLEGIDEPIEIEFDRAGRIYFIERKGAVKRYEE